MRSLVASSLADIASEKLGTNVSIGSVNMGMLNRITIDNIRIEDQCHKDMLRAPRISVKVNIFDLISGKISIYSAQVFGLNANLYKPSENAPTNFQFILDSLSSDEKKESRLNLEISSLIVRRGVVSYNQLDDYDSGIFSTKHINISDISAHLIINTLTNDSVNANIKRISFKDKSGLSIKRFTTRIVAGSHGANISEFALDLPATSIAIPEFTATYTVKDRKLDRSSLHFNGNINAHRITLSDLAPFVTKLMHYSKSIQLSASASGTGNGVSIDIKELKQENDLELKATLSASQQSGTTSWSYDITHLTTSSEGISDILAALGMADKMPTQLQKVGSISVKSSGKGIDKSGTTATTVTTDIGNADITLAKRQEVVNSTVKVDALNLATLLDNAELGNITGEVTLNARMHGSEIQSGSMEADIKEFAFRGYNYSSISLKGNMLANRTLHALAHINDEACRMQLEGDINLALRVPNGSIKAEVAHLNPSVLKLSDQWPETDFDFNISGNFNGTDINTANAQLAISDFNMHSPDGRYHFHNMNIAKGFSHDKGNTLSVISDFANISAEGHFDYQTLANSVINAIYDRLPTMPGLSRKQNISNDIKVYATISNTEWARHLLKTPLEIREPVHLIADINDRMRKVYINIDASDFHYNGSRYNDGFMVINSQNDTLKARMNVSSVSSEGKNSTYRFNAKAINNNLNAHAEFDIDSRHPIAGVLNADANFHTNSEGLSQADIRILPSELLVADTTWNIRPALVTYYKNHLEVTGVSVQHANQHLTINGIATDKTSDEIKVKLKDINVAYILDMVNFHSVEFAGFATGYAKARGLFGKPEADAHLDVKNFTFEEGHLGTLSADADWNLEDGAINVDAIAKDEGDSQTFVKGYISPKNNDIDLHIKADGTRLEFLGTFCDSFLADVDAHGWGNVEVVGPLSAVQLVGDAEVSGSVRVTALNTVYSFNRAKARLIPDDIQLLNDTIRDRDGHYGILAGHLRHKHLGKFTYDIDIAAENLLAFDTHEFGDDTFYGTIYATGECAIRGKSGETQIDVSATPNAGSVLVYNAASPDAISNREFIHWNNRDSKLMAIQEEKAQTEANKDMVANLYLNLLINTTPDATLKVIMDQTSGDYIALNGNGVIRAAYYNKGAFDLFGNYNVERGNYRLTIQNVIKRDFEFLPGGTIAFGGDAYNAALNLQAQYTLNSVPLSDINIGKSFTNNNIRVDCLMNITGTPAQPHVDFALDIPTVSTDAKQMIMSLMNSEEEMNQQVIYLLAIGRFLNQGTNNAYSEEARQSQTSLAMQSILSGTISQQLSQVLENVVGNNNWNLGANISTGDEGFNNAEYEGLLSGRLLNNRLLIDGQFGYRDNQNATSSFIGDFDMRYLLRPDGGAAIKVYNQTNDRYFTKNSLNTQGIGLILKKDFNSLLEFLPRRKKK